MTLTVGWSKVCAATTSSLVFRHVCSAQSCVSHLFMMCAAGVFVPMIAAQNSPSDTKFGLGP